MRYHFVVAGLFLLASCDQSTTHREPLTSSLAPALLEATTQPLAAAMPVDTAAPYTVLPSFFDSVQIAPVVRMNGSSYRLQVTAKNDSTRPVRYTPPPVSGEETEPADSAGAGAVTGYEGTYTFRLLRPNGKLQFERKLKKSDFKGLMGEDLVVESDAMQPVFSGYLPGFKALAFEVSFYPPESDAGGQVLLLLDAATGRVIHKGLARWTDGCNSAAVVSSNGRLLLTSCELLQANGKVTNLEKPGRTIAGTMLVNDQTALVVYAGGYDKHGHEVPLRGHNAELIDCNGRLLSAFDLESTDGGLGSSMLDQYVAQTRTHYLFDDANGKLGLIPRDQPARLRVMKLNQLPVFRAPQRPTELRIDFTTEVGTHATFYADTVSNKLRYRLAKPSY